MIADAASVNVALAGAFLQPDLAALLTLQDHALTHHASVMPTIKHLLTTLSAKSISDQSRYISRLPLLEPII